MIHIDDVQQMDCARSADHPVIASAGEGAAWLAWTEICEDRVVVHHTGGGDTEISAPRPLGPPALTAAHDSAVIGIAHSAGHVSWYQLQRGEDAQLLRETEGLDPAACCDDDGRMHLFWRLPDGALAHIVGDDEMQRIAGPNVRRPTAAALSNGRILVAWDDAAPEGRAICALVLAANGTVESGPQVLTTDLRINTTPCAVADGTGRVFVVWENCRTNIIGRGFDHFGSEAILQMEDTERFGGTGYRLERCILGAVYTDNTLRWFGGRLGSSPLPLAMDAVKPAVAALPGRPPRIWLAYQAYCDDEQWSVWCRQLAAGKCCQPTKIGAEGGPFSRTPAACSPSDDGLLIAWQQADGSGPERRSAIQLAHLNVRPTPRASGKHISRPIPMAVPDVPKAPECKSIAWQNQHYRLYFGDLHMHSELSACSRHKDGNLREKYEFARDVKHLDFAAITDHSREFTEGDWALLQETAKAYRKEDVFLPFLAFEFIVSKPGLSFHRQIIRREPAGPQFLRDNDPRIDRNADIWPILDDNDAIAVLHQPADASMNAVYEDHDPRFQPLVEIYQLRGSYEKWGGDHWVFDHRWRHYAQAHDVSPNYADKPDPEDWLNRDLFVQNALARGLMFGFCGGGEHEGSGIMGVYAADLTPDAIFDAIISRRCFATTGERIFVDARLNDNLMGAVCEVEGERVLSVRAIGTAQLQRITVVKNNVDVWSTELEDNCEAELEWTDDVAEPAPDWHADHDCYYVRVGQVDGHMAWSSPIFVKS